MFSFGSGSGKSVNQNAYTVVQVRKSAKRDTSPRQETSPMPHSLQPSIDGPPSPERIRAYTEQMKRSSIFGSNSRTHTLSSITSSSRSRDSDLVSLSRKSSSRSNASSMPSSRSDRPESVQKFGKSIFSRAGRKARRESNALTSTSSSLTVGDNGSEEMISARENYYGMENDSRKKHLISGPYNFQHLTHTRPDHVSKLGSASVMELVSEFSALRASQAPTNGELKGIRAQDLHFENFSSEALSSPTEESGSQSPHPHGNKVEHNPVSPIQPQRYLNYARSVDNLRSPPPRPPRSPLSPTCPVALPARTSSRTASMLFDKANAVATESVQRPPPSNGGFRKPAPFVVPVGPSPLPPWSEQQEEHLAERPTSAMSHAITTPGDEAWPLTAPIGGTFGELADVQEEEEDRPVSRRSKISNASSELRASASVPVLRLKSYDQFHRPLSRMSTTHERSSSNATVGSKAPTTPPVQITDDWEKDVDFCYDNELEAVDDYQWERSSVEDDVATSEATSAVAAQQPAVDLHLEDDDRSVYHGRFRPSLLVPSPYDIPELSPLSNTSTTSDPRTPTHFLRPGHARSPSQASSFKESHGFNLSPSLLIPNDFSNQMDQEILYEEHFRQTPNSGSIFAHDPYSQSFSTTDDSTSSIASYRSSSFSRVSARSSSSTRLSVAHSRASQDSVMMLSRAASLNKAHRSIGSASSLPDLVPSILHRSEQITDLDFATSKPAEGDQVVQVEAPPVTAHQHRRLKSATSEQMLRKGGHHISLSASTIPESLSPVAESFMEIAKANAIGVHERKVSAPVVSHSVKEFSGRARASTSAGSGTSAGGKKRANINYQLFPQV